MVVATRESLAYADVAEVREVYKPDEVNTLLAQGWCLLTISSKSAAAKKPDGGFYVKRAAAYVMGRLRA